MAMTTDDRMVRCGRCEFVATGHDAVEALADHQGRAHPAAVREYQLGDDEVAIISIDRQIRIAAEVKATLLRNLSGVDPAAADACARNLAAGWGDYGIKED